MPVTRGHRRGGERVNEDDVQRVFMALNGEQRAEIFRFEDAALVQRIRESLQVLYERQSMMEQLGLGSKDGADPFESSTLLKKAFEFSWSMARHKDDQDLILVNPKLTPVLLMKQNFAERDDFFENVRVVLPDFLCRHTARAPMPRARWKEICAQQPTSVSALEQQLAKLIEQALWLAVMESVSSPKQPPAASSKDSAVVDNAGFKLEPWMAEYDAEQSAKAKEQAQAEKKKKARKSKIKTPATPLKPTLEETERQAATGESDYVRPCVLASHYWGGGVASPRGRSAPDKADNTAAEPTFASVDTNEAITTAPGLDSDAEDACCSNASEVDGALLLSPDSRSTPVPRPRPPSLTMQPGQLVSYLWGKTSQFGQRQCSPTEEVGFGSVNCPDDTNTPADGYSSVNCPDDAGTPKSRSVSSSWASCSSIMSPLRRGEWSTEEPQTPSDGTVKVFVRNTFIDIEDMAPGDTRNVRASRSLSPAHLGASSSYNPQNEDTDQWHWFWH